MTENTQRQIQSPSLETRLKASNPRTKDLLKDYVGKHVVMELQEIGTDVFSGTIDAYDGRFVRVKDMKHHRFNLSTAKEVRENPSSYSDPQFFRFDNPRSIKSSLSSRTINANLIASIQDYEEVTGETQ